MAMVFLDGGIASGLKLSAKGAMLSGKEPHDRQRFQNHRRVLAAVLFIILSANALRSRGPVHNRAVLRRRGNDRGEHRKSGHAHAHGHARRACDGHDGQHRAGRRRRRQAQNFKQHRQHDNALSRRLGRAHGAAHRARAPHRRRHVAPRRGGRGHGELPRRLLRRHTVHHRLQHHKQHFPRHGRQPKPDDIHRRRVPRSLPVLPSSWRATLP